MVLVDKSRDPRYESFAVEVRGKPSFLPEKLRFNKIPGTRSCHLNVDLPDIKNARPRLKMAYLCKTKTQFMKQLYSISIIFALFLHFAGFSQTPVITAFQGPAAVCGNPSPA